MKNLTKSEIERIKDVLFVWLTSDNLQTWATAAAHLIKLGEISTQEAQSEAIKYMNETTAVFENEQKKDIETRKDIQDIKKAIMRD